MIDQDARDGWYQGRVIGQGAIAVECRSDDSAALEFLRRISDPESVACLTAERAFLAELGTGCDLPVAALAVAYETIGAHASDDPVELSLDALVASPDGTRIIRVDGSGFDPSALGREVAAQILDRGGGELLRKAR